jgi:DNA adenine methylase
MYFPEKFDRFFDPFVGGGSSIPYNKNKDIFVGDIIPELIFLWEIIRDFPSELKNFYTESWEKQKQNPDYYYHLRDVFNKTRNPYILFFLTRLSYSGLVRFNSKKEFNVSLHFGRDGMQPSKISPIIDDWSKLIQDVTFVCCDYKDLLENAIKGDFVFLDPPYVGTKGQYHPDSSNFDFIQFYEALEILNKKGVLWMLTLGFDDKNNIPNELYRREIFNDGQNSSLARLKNITKYSKDVIYTNY